MRTSVSIIEFFYRDSTYLLPNANRNGVIQKRLRDRHFYVLVLYFHGFLENQHYSFQNNNSIIVIMQPKHKL